MKRIMILTILCSLMSIGCGMAQIDKKVEIEKLMFGLNSTSQEQRVDSAKYILKFNVNDPTLNKKTAEILNVGYKKDGDSSQIEEMLWMCRVLTASGDRQYMDLFREVALMSPNRKLRSCVLESVEAVHEVKQDKTSPPVQTFSTAETLDNEQSKIIGMLKSKNIGSRRDAAKLITQNVGIHESVYVAAEESLLEMTVDFQAESLYVDTMAWLCKALGASGESQYINTLEKVRTQIQNGKVQKYATVALKSLAPPASSQLQSEFTLYDEATGLEWYVYPGDSRHTFDEGIKMCMELGERINKDMCLPSTTNYVKLWKNNKKSDAIKIFNRKSYLSSELELDGTAVLPLEFSFITGQYGNAYSSRVACVSVKCVGLAHQK